jgi:hypothetical protein
MTGQQQQQTRTLMTADQNSWPTTTHSVSNTTMNLTTTTTLRLKCKVSPNNAAMSFGLRYVFFFLICSINLWVFSFFYRKYFTVLNDNDLQHARAMSPPPSANAADNNTATLCHVKYQLHNNNNMAPPLQQQHTTTMFTT